MVMLTHWLDKELGTSTLSDIEEPSDVTCGLPGKHSHNDPAGTAFGKSVEPLHDAVECTIAPREVADLAWSVQADEKSIQI
jgi:hypothetical protein